MEERKAKVARLVELFKSNKSIYTSKNFVEAEVRSKFIDPFLEYLNWDVQNKKGARPDHQEVIFESRLKIEGQTKHPDYTLCHGGERRLYIEAKQPSIDLEKNPEPALQVRRYAYSSKMPIAILTDFEELAIYDTRIKPTPKDTAATARIEYLTLDKYVNHFEDLFNKISWDAVDLGKFNTYYETAKEKRGTATVDNDILQMIEDWRLLLAKDIALHNNEIDEFNLTGCVQKIIDRILFLRIAEDKEIEELFTLQKQIEKGRSDYLYDNLKKLFDLAGAKYNAGLFDSDQFLNALKIQDQTLSSIINALYYPECQYEFSVIPVEILGSIYERFLGKIIRFTRKTKNGHGVEVIEKPEVKKAGGVYYTPTYIVKYIVQQTIGKKIEGKTPAEISSMRFLDPACGSGSFLVGTYQYLLDYHLDYYQEHNLSEAEKTGKIYKDSRTQTYKLSVEEKRRILTNNIYGVDIDAQAVEVTKLSLFLKLLENEGRALGKGGQVDLFRRSDIQQRILPGMSGNIKCGNSLIGSDYYDDKDLLHLGLQEQRKVNVFDWKEAFASILNQGGFDCVIGNPPYVFARDSKEKGMNKEEKEYYYPNYKLAKYQINLYQLFIERSSYLMKEDGIFSFIIPNNWLTINTSIDFRKFIISKSNIIVLNFLYKVFDGANVDTCILIFRNKGDNNIELYKSNTPEQYIKIKDCKSDIFSNRKHCIINIDILKDDRFLSLIEKIEKNSVELSTIATVKSGLKAYEIGKGDPSQTKEMKDNRVYHSDKKIDDDWFKYIDGDDVKRYSFTWTRGEYLKYGKNLAAPRSDFGLYSTPRILVRQIPSQPPYCINSCFTSETFLNDLNSMNIVYIKCNPLFLLAVLNSRLISFWFEYAFGKFSRGLFPQFKVNELECFPIPTASEQDQSEISELAKKQIETNTKLNSVTSSRDREMIEQRIRILDKQINTKVYQLYNLTEDEIRVVEGS